MQHKAVTLLEMLVIIIILGVLASVGIVGLAPFKENTLDKEAQANLRLIIAAERMHRMETGGYYPGATNAELNENLKLSLPTGGSTLNWNYKTTASGGNCCAQATRVNGPNTRTWRMRKSEDVRNTEDDPVGGPGATCP